MKAVLTDGPFDDPGWVYERKLDGIRCLAIRDGAGARLLSRNDLPLDGRFPELAAAVAQLPGDLALDGEVVALAGGQTSFARLARSGRESATIAYYVFDALVLDGQDLRELPLSERRERLERLQLAAPLHLTERLAGSGIELFEQACQAGWEGLIAKRPESRYEARRSRDWLKV